MKLDASSSPISHETLPSTRGAAPQNAKPAKPATRTKTVTRATPDERAASVAPRAEYSQESRERASSSAPLTPLSHRWLAFSLVALATLLVLWALPHWQMSGLNLVPKERVIMENTLRDTWAKIIATLFFLISAYFLWRYIEAVGKTVAAAERTVAAAEKSAAISSERHITERFVRVMELLGDEKLEVRLGGIYALERIARDSPDDQSAVTEVLATYIREHAPWQEGIALPARVRADVQAILTVLGRRAWADNEEQPLDLHESALATAYLPFAKLQRAFLYEANLRGAMLYRANLRGAWLWKAQLHNTILEGAHLEGADLTAVEGLTWEQLQQANIDKATKLPEYLRASAPDNLPDAKPERASTPSAEEPEDEPDDAPVFNSEALPTKRG
jgi:hypothetical protein